MSSPLAYELIEPQEKPAGSVIWLHGLGADGHDFIDIVPQLKLNHLNLRFVFPHAPIIPVTLNANTPMRAWFDVYALGNKIEGDKEGVVKSSALVKDLIEAETNQGIDSRQIILAGFSQGGAMALYTGLRYPKPLAGILGLSTYLPKIEELGDEHHQANTQTPIMMAHGTSDTVLPMQLGEQSYQALKSMHYNIQWHEYPMEHQVCMQEINDISKWMQAVLPSSDR